MKVESETFLVAAINGDVGQLIRSLDGGVDPDIVDDHAGNTALYNATIRDQVDAIHILLKRGANPNLRLDYRSPVDNRKELQVVVLMYAMSPEAALALIEAGAEVNVSDSVGVTPLIRATQRGNEDVVRILLQAGADVTHKSAGGQCASDIAKAMVVRYKEFNVGSNAPLVNDKVARFTRIQKLLEDGAT